MANPTVTRGSGQVLVFFALALPIVLLPVAAYALDAVVTTSDYARLVELTARAAEDAAQQIDVGTLRQNGSLVLDVTAAVEAARGDVHLEPAARLVSVLVTGTAVTVATSEDVPLPLKFFGDPAVTLHASATARIVPGYSSPSSRLPLPVSTF